jgi:transposase
MNVRYRITLTAEEWGQLRAFVQGGKGPVRRLKRAQILLAAAAGSSDEAIAANVSVGTSTVYRTKRRFVEEGLEAALIEEPRPGAERKLDAKEEALLIAVACSDPPSGRARWTLDLLGDEMVRLTKHDAISSDTIRRRLAEKELKPWLKKMWCIPKVDSEFVARMEEPSRRPARSRRDVNRAQRRGGRRRVCSCREGTLLPHRAPIGAQLRLRGTEMIRARTRTRARASSVTYGWQR